MSVDPIGGSRNASGLEGVERVAGKPAERATDDLGEADRDHGEANVGSGAVSKLRLYLAAGATTSPGREARLVALGAAIANGSYQVPIDALARKLLGNGH
ncbi:MAG: flagellar biosynthesis anti-sigma factor FlgM [Chloroflexota bacterium]